MATIFDRDKARKDKAIAEATGEATKAAAPAPAPQAPPIEFFGPRGPIDPEVKAARDRAKLKLLRERR